jgi:hypothetical protein
MGTATLAASEVRDAFTGLGRALKRVALYRRETGRHAEYIEPALAPLQALLARQPALTLSVLPTALVYAGEPVLGEQARENSVCFNLYRDGIRRLTFLAGLDLDELIVFVSAALPDEPGGIGREDAVTELWKADLRFVQYAAVSGYQMDAEDTDVEGTAAASARARQSLDREAHDEEEERIAQAAPPLLSPKELAAFDPQEWTVLADRSARLILDIVQRDAAGRDLASLTDTLGKLLDEMLAHGTEHGAADALADLLEGAARLDGPQAKELRTALGARIGDPTRLARMLDLSLKTAAEFARAVPAWLALLPPEAGGLLLDLLGARGREPEAARLANAAVDRLWTCRPAFEHMLRTGEESAVCALLAALRTVPAPFCASVAAQALVNPSSPVRIATLPLVAADPVAALRHLGPLLRHSDAALRIAAAEALGSCAASDGAARLLLVELEGPQAGRASHAEQVALHRALGRLGTSAGLRFLQERLTDNGGIFRRRSRLDDESLLAVQGLVADGSARAVEILDEAARSSPHLRVSASSRAAGRLLRSRPKAAA